MCDLRLQSKHADGVPDDVVVEIIEALINKISNTASVNLVSSAG
ncbi:MAG: hypothetical protein N3A61_00375 [Ignavibacteria bacterium]|nr:hypothetical protein [Ignavibacteria bacterium]